MNQIDTTVASIQKDLALKLDWLARNLKDVNLRYENSRRASYEMAAAIQKYLDHEYDRDDLKQAQTRYYQASAGNFLTLASNC